MFAALPNFLMLPVALLTKRGIDLSSFLKHAAALAGRLSHTLPKVILSALSALRCADLYFLPLRFFLSSLFILFLLFFRLFSFKNDAFIVAMYASFLSKSISRAFDFPTSVDKKGSRLLLETSMRCMSFDLFVCFEFDCVTMT